MGTSQVESLKTPASKLLVPTDNSVREKLNGGLLKAIFQISQDLTWMVVGAAVGKTAAGFHEIITNPPLPDHIQAAWRVGEAGIWTVSVSSFAISLSRPGKAVWNSPDLLGDDREFESATFRMGQTYLG